MEYNSRYNSFEDQIEQLTEAFFASIKPNNIRIELIEMIYKEKPDADEEVIEATVDALTDDKMADQLYDRLFEYFNSLPEYELLPYFEEYGIGDFDTDDDYAYEMYRDRKMEEELDRR